MTSPGGPPDTIATIGKASRLSSSSFKPPHPSLSRAAVDRRCDIDPVSAQTLVNRAEWLQDDERDLIREVYGRGRSVHELARIMRVPSRPLGKRISRIVRRLVSRPYVFVLMHHHVWSAQMRDVAITCIVQGRPLREAAPRLNLSYHTVRRSRDLILHMAEAAHQGTRQSQRGAAS
jgi:hypothetical protein